MDILSKDILAESKDTRVVRMEIAAPLIAKKVRPGQFVVIIVNEKGERIPLTVVDANENSGSITLIFQELGFTTKLLGKLNPGDSLYALTGPLGHATEIKKYGKVILVGGGVGIAEIYPVAKALKKAGNKVITIIGARTKGLLILESELKKISNELYVTTDDGSHGTKGFVTDILKGLRGDLVYAVGPIPMMRKVSEVSNQKTLVSLNTLMVDATGMCGCCRVSVGGDTKFACVDGPEFDGHKVDWNELENRSRIYLEKEKHICRLDHDKA